MKTPLPLYQHPTLIILVDDSASFVASLEFQMHPSLAVKSFASSVEALRWIFATFRQPALEAEAGVEGDRIADDFNGHELSRLYRTVLDGRRFATPAVVVVDYAMPHIDGLDFCRALEGLPCKKILFTGEADEMVAVDAFNQGLIDRYLKKGDPEAMERLGVEVSALERQYFLEKSGPWRALMERTAFGFWTDDSFVRLVQHLSRRHGFVEHFVFPDPAGILFFDAEGAATLMVVENRIGFRSHLEAAQEYGAPEELQEALREHRVVPFFWPTGGMYTENLVDWQHFAAPANVCEGRDMYFWALFDLPSGYLEGEIYSYRQFLNDRMRSNMEA